MSVKALARIQEIYWSSSTEFTCDVRYVYFDNSQNQGTIEGLGPFTAGIAQLTLENSIKDSVKDYLSIGALDTVRLLGATL